MKFGTDGVRGRAHEDVTVDGVAALGIAAAEVLESHAVVVAADTRESGPAFVGALANAFGHAGFDVWDLGDAPTPVVAHVAAQHNVVGAMVSASHNPFYDNGVKLFAPGGRKLTNDQQAAIEAGLQSSQPIDQLTSVSATARPDLVDDYIQWLCATVPSGGIGTTKVVVDCANGAASRTTERVFAALDLDATIINNAPDGRNINNKCGSTHLDGLSQHVVAAGADLGIAFDGDADRMLAVDRFGNLVDGDQIIGICALDLHRRGALRDDTVAVTVMTNLGFRLGMTNAGIAVHVTPVGDRHVLEALEANNWSLGGEQSGHVIFHDLATTGDGVLCAVQLLSVLAATNQPLDQLADEAMTRLPQRLRNVEITGTAAAAMDAIQDDIARVDSSLGETGRLLVRPSGTEPLIRVMAEAPTQREADQAVDSLVSVLEGLS